MSTVANSRNTFVKRLEISQIGDYRSQCTLQSVFLEKTENYTLQIQKLVINTTPTINLIKGAYFEIFRRPTFDITGAISNQDDDGYIDPVLTFTPIEPKTVLDVFTQMDFFCRQIDLGLEVTLFADYKIAFRMTQNFGDAYYLKLNKQFADLVLLPEYIYTFRRLNRLEPAFIDANIQLVVSHLQQLGNGYTQDNRLFYDEVDEANDVIISTRLIFADYNEIFAVSAEPIDGDAFYPWIVSLDTIRSLDTRVSWDLVCSLPSDSKYECLQSKGNLKRVTARFPVGDMIQSSNVWRSSGGFEITESVHIGIEDVCRGNPDTQTLNLHTGEIRTINSELLVRYMDNKTIKTVPAVMGSTGFWSALLLFSKRIK